MAFECWGLGVEFRVKELGTRCITALPPLPLNLEGHVAGGFESRGFRLWVLGFGFTGLGSSSRVLGFGRRGLVLEFWSVG